MHTRMRLAITLANALILGSGAGIFTGSTAWAAEERRPDPAMADYFELKVRPVLAAHCWECHGPNKQKAGLRLDSPRSDPQGRRDRAGTRCRQARIELAGRGDRL